MNRRGMLAVLAGAPIAAHLKPQTIVGVDWAKGEPLRVFEYWDGGGKWQRIGSGPWRRIEPSWHGQKPYAVVRRG